MQLGENIQQPYSNLKWIKPRYTSLEKSSVNLEDSRKFSRILIQKVYK